MGIQDTKEFVKAHDERAVEVSFCEGRGFIAGEIDGYADDGFWIRPFTLSYIRYDNVDKIQESEDI